MNKICILCNKLKPIRNFVSWQVKSGEIKYGTSCSACLSKEYRSKNKERCRRIQVKSNIKYNNNKKTMKLKLLEHINQTHCQQCGIDDPVILCFHHIDPTLKKFTIKFGMTHSYSLETLKKEAEKCCVLCMNCHTLLHYLGENCKRPEHRKRAIKTKKLKNKLLEAINQSECKICGKKEPLVFHHRNSEEKSYTISEKINTLPFNELLKEAQKCDILCMNCHVFVHNY